MMPDDKLAPTNPPYGDRVPLPVEQHGAPAPTYGQKPYYPDLEPEMEGLDWRRYLHSLVRYKWLIVGALLIGAGASYWVWQTTPVEYQAEGALWIEGDGGRFAPIQGEGILESSAWIELLRSYSVLDSVVVEQRMHISAPGEHRAQFASLKLTDRFQDGDFELRIDANGTDYTLTTPEDQGGAVLERGRLGEAIGESLGYDWWPAAGSFAAGDVVPFSVRRPRDASRGLASRLRTLMDRDGNFLEIYYTDTSAERAARIVNALMARHVAVSEDIKHLRLRERLVILEEQLRNAETELLAAEQAYQEFRVNTITLPSDGRGAVVRGLQATTNPVFDSFFQNRIRQEEIAETRARLRAALESFEESGEVRIDALEMIPETANSSELRRSIDELIDARAQLRALSDRYSPDYPPIQDLEVQIESIESSIAGVVRGIVGELETTERSLSTRLARQSAELQSIPPVAIEDGRLARSVQVTDELYNDLRSRVETARIAAVTSLPEVRILDEAQVPSQPLADNRLRLAIMIMAGSLGAAVVGAVLLDQTDAKFRYASDVSREMGLDILGSIPRLQGGKSKQGIINAAHALEAFRELRIHTGFAHGSAGPIMLAVTSPAAGEGKSLISSNLAVSFAEVGRRTLLIDGDTRRGDAHKLLGLSQSPGLIDYLSSASEDIIQTSEHDNLDFIGCGARGASTPELLASSRMAHFMGTLKQRYDVVIVDCPPLTAGGDTLILGTLTGSLTIVIRTGSTEKHLTQAKLAPISRLPIRILGVVLNDVDPEDGYNNYYYYSSYLPGYEALPAEGDEGKAPLLSDGRA